MIKTARLQLRPFQLSDADPLFALFSDPEVMRYSEGIKNRAEADAWLKFYLDVASERPIIRPRAVVHQGNGLVIGYCGLFYFDDVNGRSEIEIGYRLRQVYWGQGYATEAATAVRDYAFGQGISRLIALIDPGNSGSIRVAEKIGMRKEGEVMFDGYTHPDWVYVVEQDV